MGGIILKGGIILFDILLCCGLLLGHSEDGNIFGIYIINKTLLIGDFWASLLLVYFLLKEIPKDIGKLMYTIIEYKER